MPDAHVVFARIVLPSVRAHSVQTQRTFAHRRPYPLTRPGFMPSDMLKILTLIATLMASATCNAGAFSVTPVRLFFDPRDKAVAITLTNDGDEEVVLQADVYQWTQNLNGLDKTEPTEDLIVSPPSLRLPPRSRQVVRLGLLIPRDRARQMTYRLLVREIPEAERRKDATLQLPIALVLNMPIFITPSGASRKIDCGWEKGEGAKPSLSCMNTGAAYAQVRSAEIRRGGLLLGKTEGSPYILAGVRRSLPLQDADHSTMEPGIAQLTLVYDDLKTETKTIEIP